MFTTHRLALLGLVFQVLAFAQGAALSAQEEAATEGEKRPFKRLDQSTDEELRKQLLEVPEVGFDQPAAARVLRGFGQPGTLPAADLGARIYMRLAEESGRADMAYLPWQAERNWQLGREPAAGLQVYSVNLRACMQESANRTDFRPDPVKMKGLLTRGPRSNLHWNEPHCVPTLAQMLQTEDSALRAMLVEMLAAIKGKQATAVLAQRSVFDISPEIREQAVAALASRPAEEYESMLLAALRWPWQPAAEHAAEAIAALQKKELAPALVRLLAEPDPKLPFHSADKKVHVREVVRLNHLSNCILCHAPSASKDDLVRGRVPVPGQEMPPLYYADTRGYFVRADTTLLRQDFSLIQPVENPGKWAGQQRYDYLLRERPATAAEAKTLHLGKKEPPKDESPEAKSYAQREAVLFALREITGMDAGERAEDWKKALAAD